MHSILEFVKSKMGYLLILAIVMGLIFPQLGILRPFVRYFLMFLLFTSFLKLDFNFSDFFRKEILIFPFLNWILFPIIVFFLSFHLPFYYRLGLLFIIITPPALGAPVIVSLANGNMPFVVSNVVIYNLISPIIYAFLPRLFFPNISEISSSTNVFISVAIVIFIPLILAIIAKKITFIKSFINSKIDPFKGIMQIFMISIVVGASAKKIYEMKLIEILIIFSITITISFLIYMISFLICKKNMDLKVTCPITAGHKNSMLSILTCINNFEPVVALPSIFYLISHHIWNGIILTISNKRIDAKSMQKSRN